MPKQPKSIGKTGRFILAKKIDAEFISDGFFGLVLQGKQRIGKSSQSQQSMAETCGEWKMQQIDKQKRDSMAYIETMRQLNSR